MEGRRGFGKGAEGQSVLGSSGRQGQMGWEKGWGYGRRNLDASGVCSAPWLVCESCMGPSTDFGIHERMSQLISSTK